MLKLNDVDVFYGKVQALEGINLELPKGSIVSLLGANGAGKSTILKVISRLVKQSRGTIELDGKILTNSTPVTMVRNGVIHCPENRRIFPILTVEDNLRVGAYLRKDKVKIKEDFEWVYQLFPRLKDRKKQLGGTLSGGEQQMLAIGRSIMSDPKILLLDEPSLGLSPKLVQEIFNTIKVINEVGKSILLVEQNVHLSLEISDYSYILENGKIALEGLSKDFKDNNHIQKLYLGV